MPDSNPDPNRKARSGVFISYARSDGEVFARQLRQRLEAEGIAAWLDRFGLEGGRDWWLQIEEVLRNQAEFLVLVLTPKALQSENVRKEWRYARQQGVCVYPIIAAPNLDFASMPRWMRDQHFYDLDQQWDKFIADLKKPCETPRVPFMVDKLPEDFVARPGEFDQLITLLLDQQREEPIAITAALRGTGGYGKTTLARALCHDERVREAFDDGILWVTLGENPGNLISRVQELIHALDPKQPSFNSLPLAVEKLRDLLADRDVLIVIDDVWNKVHLEPFTQGGPRCARLITTRNLDILPSNAQQVKVDAMQPGEAILLLGAKLAQSSEQAPQLHALAERLGHWALLLEVANRTLRDRVATGETPSEALAFHNEDLTENGLTEFAVTDDAARESVVKKVLSVSFKRLKEAEVARFYELATFPEKANVPLATVEKLWKQTGNLTRTNADKLYTRLFNLSLLDNLNRHSKTLRLHDVIRKFLNDEQKGQLAPTHNQLLDVHRPATRWADQPDDEPYLWDHLAFHLVAAGRGEELVTTVKDWRYLTKKTFLRKSHAVEKDLVIAVQIAPADDPLRTLLRNFVNTGHLFNHCASQEDVKETVYVRLRHLHELKAMLQGMAEQLKAPHIEPQVTLPDLPHPALLRTLEGHTDAVSGCALSADGKLLVSASNDRTLKVWETTTGQLRHTLAGHSDWVSGCALSADGKLLVSASYDKTLKVWETASGQLLHTLAGHSDWVSGCALSGDGKLLVSASRDSTLKVWETASGQLLHTLAGHSDWVRGCALSDDGKLLVSASDDNTLKVWETASGQLLHTLEGHSDSVWGCALSGDGKLLVSASRDSTLKVWATTSGQLLHTLAGHSDWVSGCVLSGDGKLLVSASADQTLNVWETATGQLLHTLAGHSGTVNGCALSADGKLLVSASDDNTLKVWETASGQLLHTLAGHSNWVTGCALSGDGKLLVSASWDQTLKVWETTTGQLRHTLAGHSGGVEGWALSGDGKLLVSASDDKTLKVWETASGQLLHTLKGHSRAMSGCALSADGKLLVSASRDSTLKVWETASGQLLHTLVGHSGTVNGCALSADGKLLVSASGRTLKVWETASGQLLHTLAGHSGVVRGCVLSADGKLLVSASGDRTLKVWETASGQLLHTLKGHSRAVRGCALSADGKLLVSASNDETLKVWATTSGQLLHTLAGHSGGVEDWALSGDGKLLVSASWDQTLKVWATTTGKCLATFYADEWLHCVAMSGDLIGAGGWRSVYFLRLVQS